MCDTQEGLKVKINLMDKKLDEMDARYREYKKTNIREHQELKEYMINWFEKIINKIDWLENKYVLRKEFAVWLSVIGAISVLLWIFWFFYK